MFLFFFCNLQFLNILINSQKVGLIPNLNTIYINSLQGCTVSVVAGSVNGPGFITAQGRENPNDKSGFVFYNCNIIGDGKVYLGRPWRSYARVLFYNTQMSDIIVPQGWDAWKNTGNE